MKSLVKYQKRYMHCMLFEFYKGSNPTVATKNICNVHPSALDIRK